MTKDTMRARLTELEALEQQLAQQAADIDRRRLLTLGARMEMERAIRLEEEAASGDAG